MDEDGFSDVADVTDEGYDFAPDPSSVGMDSSDFSDNSDPSLGDDDYTVTNTPTEFRTAQNYTQARGASSTNPFPESFFSQLFGADNVNYTNILGSDRINEINSLRYNQGIMGMSNETGSNTGNPYTQNDYYIGQPTTMGEVKPIPSTARDLLNFLPAGGILNTITGQPGLPENMEEYKRIMNEKAKSANEPSFFSGIMNTGKDVFNDISTGAENLFSGAFGAKTPSPVASPSGGQFGVPDTRTFDEFGNVLERSSKFQRTRPEPEGYNTVINPATGLKELRENKPYQQQADASPFSLLKGGTDYFKKDINNYLQKNINPGLEFETDYREINDELQPYMGLKYRFTA